MTKLQRLKREARDVATWRGHTLARFRSSDTRYHFAQCSQCNQGVQVALRPYSNEIDIGGEAVALNCKGSA